MINLLPPREKENLLNEEKWKLVLTIELAVFSFLISLALIFISINISVASQAEYQQTLLAQREMELQKAETKTFKAELSSINDLLSKLNVFYQQRAVLGGSFSKISLMIPDEISIEQISIMPFKKDEKKFQVSISGNAPLVENLIEFRQNLSKNPDISQISFPSSVLVEAEDIDFSITFQMIIKNE